MIDNLTTALEITVVGMSLVFGTIILLWLMMLALMRFTTDRPELQTSADEREIKRRAAVAAVAAALAHEQHEDQPHPFPLPPTAIVTAWQAVQRGNLLSQKGPRR